MRSNSVNGIDGGEDVRKSWTNRIGVDGLTFGERLKDLMVRKQVTAKTVSLHTGVSQSALSDYQKENGARIPDSQTILLLSDYFEVSTDYLFGNTHEKSRDLELKSICEFTNLSGETIAYLHSLPSNSQEANFLRRLIEDLLINQQIAEDTLPTIRKYAELYGRIGSDLPDEVNCDIREAEDGRYYLDAASAAESLLAEATAEVTSEIDVVIRSMCKQILRSPSLHDNKMSAIHEYRWEIYSQPEDWEEFYK